MTFQSHFLNKTFYFLNKLPSIELSEIKSIMLVYVKVKIGCIKLVNDTFFFYNETYQQVIKNFNKFTK